MYMLVDCSNCHTALNLPPGAKSIRGSICQAITQIADPSDPSGGSYTPFPSSSFNDNQRQYVPSGYHVVPPALPNYPGPPPNNMYGGYGRKKAVIVGVSYKNTRHELKGCINDAKFMRHLLLTRFQFPESQIVMLTEEETDYSRIPTGRNMRMALSWLINGCQPGDSLVFHFSGHGSRQKNHNGDEIDGYDETLCPLDFETEGMIIDDEINAVIVRPLPVGVRLHAIIDSCHSGTVLDLPWLCRMNRAGQYEWEDHRPKEAGIWKGSSGGEVISISGCDDDQTSADTSALSKITSTGAMTFCFIEAIEHGNASTYGSLLSSMRNSISNASRGPGGGGSSFNMLLNGRRGFTQIARISAVVGPHVAASAAEAAVTALCDENEIPKIFDIEENGKEPERIAQGNRLEVDTRLNESEKGVIPLPLRMRATSATALGAAAAHAKLLALQEDREVERLVSMVVNTQLQKLQYKMELLKELEAIMEKESAQMAELEESLLTERMDVAQKAIDAGISRWRDRSSIL